MQGINLLCSELHSVNNFDIGCSPSVVFLFVCGFEKHVRKVDEIISTDMVVLKNVIKLKAVYKECHPIRD